MHEWIPWGGYPSTRQDMENVLLFYIFYVVWFGVGQNDLVWYGMYGMVWNESRGSHGRCLLYDNHNSTRVLGRAAIPFQNRTKLIIP